MEIIVLNILSAFLISAVAMPLIIFISNRFGIFDGISERKIHTGSMSRLGGLGIFAAFIMTYFYSILPALPAHVNTFMLTLSMFIAFGTGFVDDLKPIPARLKLFLQIAAAAIAASSGLMVKSITFFGLFPIPMGYLALPVTIFWIILFMNAVNLVDGMDGLAGGLVFIGASFLAALAFINGQQGIGLMAAVLAASILGFLVFNFPPAKLFMGDGGAYFIGFMYGILPLMGISKASSATVLLYPLALLMLPLADICSVIIRRRRQQKHIFTADNNHLHHRLLQFGIPVRGVLVIIYSLTIFLGGITVIMQYTPPQYAVLIFYILVGVTSLAFILLQILERRIEVIRQSEIVDVEESELSPDYTRQAL